MKVWATFKFRSSERNTENTRSDLYLNEENDYSDENKSDNEDFLFTILQPCGNESHKKKTKHVHASATNLLHVKTAFGISVNSVKNIELHVVNT